MKTVKTAVLTVFLSLTALSCKPVNPVSALKITVGPSPANVLPIPLRSCASASDDDLAAPTFAFTTFKYQWTGTNPMKIAFMVVELKSGLLEGGDYQCFIAGDELVSALAPGSLAISANDTIEKVANCGIRCGGIKFKANLTSAYVTGTVKVVGTETDAEGNQTPFSTATDVAVSYTAY